MKFEHFDSIPSEFSNDLAIKAERGLFKDVISIDELEEECEGDKHCEQALADMLTYAVRYANDVWSMKTLKKQQHLYSREEWQEIHEKTDREKAQLHDTYIDSIRILTRALYRAERNNDWAKKLAPTGEFERAACGAFAIMLTYQISVNRSSYV